MAKNREELMEKRRFVGILERRRKTKKKPRSWRLREEWTKRDRGLQTHNITHH